MNKEGNIDLEKITSSLETVSTIENIVNYVNLSDNIEDLEKYFRQINFEHSNCLNYKESLEDIYTGIEYIKRRVAELSDALRRTKAAYTKVSSFSEDDIKEFSEIYKKTPASEGLAKLVGTNEQYEIHPTITTAIAGQTTNTNEMQTMNGQNGTTSNNTTNNNNVTTIPTPETTPQENKPPIDTLPIGIAIGATGIAGSIGAVIVDDIYRKKEKENRRQDKQGIYIEEYNEDDILDEDYDYDQIRNAKDIDRGPYHAARLEREADRFYGNQLDRFNLMDEEEEDSSSDEDDDPQYEDL